MKNSDLKIEDVYKDFRASASAFSKLYNEMQRDVEFELGKQWEQEDLDDMKGRGVLPLTINKIRPIIKLISGIERQSRSDFKVFPEGEEDTVIAEVATILLKHSLKEGQGVRKLSKMFKEGAITGACYIEPYIDYTHDILNGDLRLRKVSANRIFPDPDFEEEDLSDANYYIKFSPALSKGKMLELFPDHEKTFENLGSFKVDTSILTSVSTPLEGLYRRDYEGDGKDNEGIKEDAFDLIEYYYKKTVKRFYLANKRTGDIQQFKTEEEANEAIETALFESEEGQAVSPEDFTIIERFVPEIRLAQVVGDQILEDEVAETFPRWKSFPIIPFFAEFMSFDIKERDLLIQGIVRGLRDLQLELNKRRTASMLHLGSSANSGWLTPKGAWVDRDQVEEFGSAPGINLEYDPEIGIPQRIAPAPLSQGHEQLAQENSDDIKEGSGVNSDLLANTASDQSGKAIALKQRQGLVMVQELLDNYGESKQMLGRFLLSQLGELFTVEKAMKVCGEKFIQKNFEKPLIDEETGQPKVDENGELALEVDIEEVKAIFNKILNDETLGKFEVSIGDGVYSETIQMGNYLSLIDMAKTVPIPPQVLVDESPISQSSKGKIKTAIEQQMAVPR